MAAYLMPNTRLFVPRRFEIRMVGNVDANRSPLNGAVTTGEMPGDAWHIRLDYTHNKTDGERDIQRAFWNRLRGLAHTFKAWNFSRPEPRGTMRGSPTLAAPSIEGANSLLINGTGTLMDGDMLGLQMVGGYTQLVEVAQAEGQNHVQVFLGSPLRRDVQMNSGVILIRPTAEFLLTEAPFIPHETGASPGFSVEAIEFLR